MRRQLVATVSGSTSVELAIERDSDGSWHVELNGESQAVDAVEIRPGTWSMLVGGRSVVVDLEQAAPGSPCTAYVAGHRLELQLVDAERYRLAMEVSKRGGVGKSGEIIRAPIAGKVVKILVEEGQEVVVGQGVAVLEAMKMENEIRAEKGGVVSAIQCEPGQSVDTGRPLLTLK